MLVPKEKPVSFHDQMPITWSMASFMIEPKSVAYRGIEVDSSPICGFSPNALNMSPMIGGNATI